MDHWFTVVRKEGEYLRLHDPQNRLNEIIGDLNLTSKLVRVPEDICLNARLIEIMEKVGIYECLI